MSLYHVISRLFRFMCLVFFTKCEAAPAPAEDITLDDPFAEMTAPAEAGSIVKGVEVFLIVPMYPLIPRICRMQMYLPYFAVLVFLATQSDFPLVLMRKVLSHHIFVSAFDLLCSHKARLLSSLCSRSGSHLQVVSAAWQVPESATQDDVAEEPVKSPEACGQLWTHLYHLVSRYILDLFWGIVGGREGKLRSV